MPAVCRRQQDGEGSVPGGGSAHALTHPPSASPEASPPPQVRPSGQGLPLPLRQPGSLGRPSRGSSRAEGHRGPAPQLDILPGHSPSLCLPSWGGVGSARVTPLCPPLELFPAWGRIEGGRRSGRGWHVRAGSLGEPAACSPSQPCPRPHRPVPCQTDTCRGRRELPSHSHRPVSRGPGSPGRRARQGGSC